MVPSAIDPVHKCSMSLVFARTLSFFIFFVQLQLSEPQHAKSLVMYNVCVFNHVTEFQIRFVENANLTWIHKLLFYIVVRMY